VFFTFADNAYKIVGLVMVETVYGSDMSVRASIKKYFYTNLQTAQVDFVFKTAGASPIK
jgi:hypothetical protein